MSNETYIKKINNLLSKKTYHYESEIYSFDYILELTGEIKPLISIGEWKDFYLLNFKIFNLNDTAKRIISFIIKEHPEYKTEDKKIYDVKKPLRQLGIERSLGGMARKMLRTLNIKETITKEVLVSLSELEGDYEEFKLNIDEANSSITAGEYNAPLELGLIKWKNKTLAPFSEFVNTKFNHNKKQKTVKNNVTRIVFTL